MFTARLKVNNNTMEKIQHTWHTHTTYIHTVVLKYINVQIYKKKTMIIPDHNMHLLCVKNITPPGQYFTKQRCSRIDNTIN